MTCERGGIGGEAWRDEDDPAVPGAGEKNAVGVAEIGTAWARFGI